MNMLRIQIIITLLVSTSLGAPNHNHNYPPTKIRTSVSNAPILNDSMMGKIGASVMGESALIDKETGRIFWEGGSTSTVHASIAPFLGDLGLRHLKGTAISALLLLCVLSLVARYLRGRISGWGPTSWPLIAFHILAKLTILRVPHFDNWFLIATIAAYLLEASTCNTRRYLTNAISSPEGVEQYIESLRTENAVVTWKVRCFHYERRWLAYILAPQLIFGNPDMDTDFSETNVAPSGLLTKKVITHNAEANYTFHHCEDNTIAGVWKRAETSKSSLAPFTKIILTKLLVLPNTKARLDYFEQQAKFVTSQGQEDEYAEFSTNIQVNGFKPRMLAVRTMEGIPSTKLFRLHLFWIFTCLGMSVPFRVWFARHCDVLRVTVVKETSSEKAAPSSTKSSSWFKWNTGATPTTTPATTTTTAASSSLSRSFRTLMEELSLYGKSNVEAMEMLEDIRAASALAGVSNETAALSDSAEGELPIFSETAIEKVAEVENTTHSASIIGVSNDTVIADNQEPNSI